ncbi:sclerostin domain-containing protein 1a [Callorhinchus milii]|uniref:Sclerostin domain-containing protein 1 n=1 Tax=Callorhinchus milii TaxID=7868 RepID=A0A4W3HEI6_CALMI|nr:sclerostin domain-containing protein 1a [Callorhinchus milii]|eukprot:gi/632963461/ref/XP_007897897.1/ PREDICTED: sclerostin domain-containing protein 1 [Callorhinchus milii]
MVLQPFDCTFFVIVCIFFESCFAFDKGVGQAKNDATEILYNHHVVRPESPSNLTSNQARNGGRQPTSVQLNRNDRTQVGCRELRSTKYISDGLCTSINPVKELVCAGECLPMPVLPNWIGGYGRKYWSRRNTQEWRCVTDKTRTQRIQLQCQNGGTRTYKITVVTSCKCKRYTRQHNESGHVNLEEAKKRPSQSKKRSRKAGRGEARHKANWHDIEDKQ